MNFNKHSELGGRHAFLSASKYHWVNYSDEKLASVYSNALAAQKGTEIHDLAFRLINLGVKLPRTQKTLNMYVNDAIGYRMTPEQVLCYSVNAFGTADAISFRKNLLRISDLKTGVTPANMLQLEIYAAFFCLEYGYRPGDIDILLRIYQNDEVIEHEPDIDSIAHIMDRTITADRRIEELKQEALT